MVLPFASFLFATSRPAHRAAPLDMPARIPSFLASARALPGIFVGHEDDLIQNVPIQHIRHESRADPLDLVRPDFPFESIGESAGSIPMILPTAFSFQDLAHPGDGPPCPIPAMK